jgi:heme exporter protein CcmD
MTFKDFISMSGYGAYVWSSYALALVVVAGNLWSARRGLREQIVHARRRLQINKEAQS